MSPFTTLIIVQLAFLASYSGGVLSQNNIPCSGSNSCSCDSGCVAVVGASNWGAGSIAGKLFSCCVSNNCYCCEALTYLSGRGDYAANCAGVSAIAPSKCPCNCMPVTMTASPGSCPSRKAVSESEERVLPHNLNFTTFMNPSYLDLSSLRTDL